MDKLQTRTMSQPPYKSVWFWVIPFFVSIVAFSLVSMIQNVSGFPEGLKTTLDTYQLPLSLISSCIMLLIQWLITDSSSKPSELEQQQAVINYLREEYKAREQLFIKHFGKLTSDRNFSFIIKEDLPAIYSRIYAESELVERCQLKISEDVVSVFDAYFKSAEKVLEDGLKLIQEEDGKPEPNKHIKESVIIQLLQHSNRQTLLLHHHLGMRLLPLSSSDMEAYKAAYFEVLHLANFIGNELEPVVNNVIDAPSSEVSNSQEDIQSMFDAAQEIAESLMTTSGEASYENLYQSIQLSAIIKRATGTNLYLLALQVVQENVLDSLLDTNGDIGAVEVDDTYPKYDIYNKEGNKKLTISFVEMDKNSIEMHLNGYGESITATVRYIDSEQKRFEIDKDMGARFIAQCDVAIKKHLLDK
ncbi:hypothetical protein [Vibrio parahaemolyticus]|uniref:hypothetical protein n=1 Tax=Vibrio parahaemolyticus TaxID=670 RepID=UPI00128E9D05|nr:hypothetical protein [Vibrio parahaemolyticus]MQD57754.1 hypothetical protein [Vibrio parahaemolyticus]HCE1405679.1 hypothetical protein [Vibrio parahaemolyticus]